MWRVLAVMLCLGGNACSSDPTTETVDTGSACSEVPLDPPSDVQAGTAMAQVIRVTWTAPDGAAGYIVVRSDSEDGTFTEIGRTIDTRFDDTGLGDGVTRYYRVIAANIDGESCPSEVAEGRTRS